MSNDGEFIGCGSQPTERLNAIEKARRIHCPDARVECKRVLGTNVQGLEDFIFLFRVFYREDKVVETNSGDAFIRLGDSKYRLSEDEKRELAIDKGQVSLELEPCGLEWPNDFDLTLIRAFAINVRRIQELSEDISDVKILENRHLGKTRNGVFVPNIACALLFSNDANAVIPGCAVRFLKYQGINEQTGEQRNVIKTINLEGRVPDLIVGIDEIIQSQIRERSVLGKDNRFYPIPEYPQPAWYEAIVNACVHRSYSLKGMNIFVKMFDDRLVIESPGGFMPYVTPDNIYDMHVRRNYFLMDAMFYMAFVKCENEGVKRMRRMMAEAGLPAPVFEQKQVNKTVVRVTLRNNIQQSSTWVDKDASDAIGEMVFKSLDPYAQRIINHVAEYKRINVTQAMRLTNLRWHRAKKLLDGLVERKLLRYVGKFIRDSRRTYVFHREPSARKDYPIPSRP